MDADTVTGDLAQRFSESLDAWIAGQAASLGMTVAELAERFDLDVGSPEFHLDPNSAPVTVSVEHTVRLLPKEGTPSHLSRIADMLEKLVDSFAQAQHQDHYALTSDKGDAEDEDGTVQE